VTSYFGYQYAGDFSATGFAVSAASGCASAAVSGGNCGRGAVSGGIGHFGSQFGFSGTVAAGCVSATINGGSCGAGARDAATSYAINYVVRSAVDAGIKTYREAKGAEYRSGLTAAGPSSVACDCGNGVSSGSPGFPSPYFLTGLLIYHFLDTLSAPLQAGLQWALNVNGAASEAPKIHEGQQGKHVPGHNNFEPGKSELTDPSPQDLLDKGAGTGQQVGNVPSGQPGSKERVDFGKNIGTYVDPVTGQRSPTNIGIIHNGSRGSHIVPSRPGL
jgi:filamentous hemagglutinin